MCIYIYIYIRNVPCRIVLNRVGTLKSDSMSLNSVSVGGRYVSYQTGSEQCCLFRTCIEPRRNMFCPRSCRIVSPCPDFPVVPKPCPL